MSPLEARPIGEWAPGTLIRLPDGRRARVQWHGGTGVLVYVIEQGRASRELIANATIVELVMPPEGA